MIKDALKGRRCTSMKINVKGLQNGLKNWEYVHIEISNKNKGAGI